MRFVATHPQTFIYRVLVPTVTETRCTQQYSPQSPRARQAKVSLYSLFTNREQNFTFGMHMLAFFLVVLPTDEKCPSQAKHARTAHSLVTQVQARKAVSTVLRAAAHLGSELYWRWACWKLSRSSWRCRCT